MEVDGAVLEGGGQILRNAAAYSCLLRKTLHISRIRASRSKPGLKAQHAAGLQLLANMSAGALHNGHVGSCEIKLEPDVLTGGSFAADAKTAGSICLMIQSALPCAVFSAAPVHLQLRGGTNATMAPQLDYFLLVLLPLLQRMGVQCAVDIHRRGYFPKGGGEVHLRVEPSRSLAPIVLVERGTLVAITGVAFVAGTIPTRVATTMAKTAERQLRATYPGVNVTVEVVVEAKAVGNGTGIVLVAETSTGCRLGGSALGERGVPAEAVGSAAADELMRAIDSGACVDEYLADQLVIFMALAAGTSRMLVGNVSLHTQTAIHFAGELCGARISVEPADGAVGLSLVTCEGVAHAPPLT